MSPDVFLIIITSVFTRPGEQNTCYRPPVGSPDDTDKITARITHSIAEIYDSTGVTMAKSSIRPSLARARASSLSLSVCLSVSAGHKHTALAEGVCD